MIVDILGWPGQLRCNLDLPIFVDEDILGSHIANFLAVLVELVPGRKQCVDQIPELGLIEEFLLELRSIVDLIGKHIGEILEQDLKISQILH